VSDEEIIRRLDRLIAIMLLANRDAIESAKAAVRQDRVSAEILDQASEGWIRSGDLQKRVSAATQASTRTVRNRLQDLAAQQAIEQRGAGPATEYRSTGLL
jgi:DNA-binding HxlR family transcriptional regulator